MTRRRQRVLSWAIGAGSLLAVLLIWEVAGARNSGVGLVFPPPSRFLPVLLKGDFKIGLGSQAATIPQSILSSVIRVMLGLLLGFVGSLLCGFGVSVSTTVKQALMPLLRVLAPIAPVAWIPLALVLFGIGNQAAVFIVFMGVFFTLTIAAIFAIESVPKKLLDSGRALGATPWQLWFHVILPCILPVVFNSLRLNFVAAWMAVLAAEMTGLQDGLGAIIMIGRNLFDNNLILLGMFLIGIVGAFSDLFLKLIQRKFFWWSS
jgi:NitT/TauT family transport system permease protein